jgi:hypothetical protein
LIFNTKSYQLKTIFFFFLQNELQNLTIITSKGQTTYPKTEATFSLTESVPTSLLPLLASIKSNQACNAICKTNQKHINIFTILHPTQKINPAGLMDSTFKVGKCIPC